MDTTFASGTVITKEWLQYINDFVYDNIVYAPVDFNLNSTNTDHVLENTAKIQAALDAAYEAGGGKVVLPGGTIYVNQLVMREYVSLEGAGMYSTALKLAPSTNTNLLVDYNYQNNLAYSSFPYRISFLTLDGNKSNNTVGSALIIMCYNGEFSSVRFTDAADHGVMLSSETLGGTAISNTVPNNRFTRCLFEDNDKAGFYGYDNSRNKQADGMFTGCIFNNNGADGWAQFRAQRFAGFTVNDTRFYNGYTDDMLLSAFGLSQITNCNFELRAHSAAGTGYFSCIRISGGAGGGSDVGTIVGNQFWLNPTTPASASIFAALSFDNALGPLAVCHNYFLAGTITNKRAFYGATGCSGKTHSNVFEGFSTSTELGSAWVNWTRTTLPADATDLASAIALVNALKADYIAQGFAN